MGLNADELKKAAEEAEALRRFLAEGQKSAPLNSVNVWEEQKEAVSKDASVQPVEEESLLLKMIRRKSEANNEKKA